VTKKVDLEVWHQRVDHMNFRNFLTLCQRSWEQQGLAQ
jgi:hypothetical protein